MADNIFYPEAQVIGIAIFGQVLAEEAGHGPNRSPAIFLYEICQGHGEKKIRIRIKISITL